MNTRNEATNAINSTNTPLPRRTFIAGAVAGTVAATQPVQARTVRRKQVSPNEKITVGLIACQAMGAHNARWMHDKGKGSVEIIAVCDVDDERLNKEAAEWEKRTGKKPATYKDYRKLLERRDINVVIIGTPDHWHALNHIHACEAGKDVYCEKPVSHNIVEANAMVAATKRFNRVVQVGTWQRSNREFTDSIALVRSGKLGRITQVRAWKTDPAQVGNQKAQPVPANLDYDMWTGPAEMVPYASNHVHSNWRWFMNYGTGMTGDWGVHMMDIALLGMSQSNDLVMPEAVTCYGGKVAYPQDDRTAPDTVQAIYRFKNPDVVLHWSTGRDHPGRPDHGAEWVFADGKTLRVWRGGRQLLDSSGKELPFEQAEATNDHMENFLECLRTRKQPRSDISSMAQTTIVCHLANASYLAGETVYWDKAKMDIKGKAGKNTLAYQRSYRKGYSLPVHKP